MQLSLILVLAFAACLFAGSAWAQYDPDDQYHYQPQDRDDQYMAPQMDMARMARLADRVEDWSRHMYQESQRRLSPEDGGYVMDNLYDLQGAAAQFHQDAAQNADPARMQDDFQRLATTYFRAEAQMNDVGNYAGDLQQDFGQIRGTMEQIGSYFGGLTNFQDRYGEHYEHRDYDNDQD